MAQVVAETVGRPVSFQQITGGEFVAMLAGFGATPQAADSMLAMIAAQDRGIYEAELGEDHPGTAPTTFAQWCEEVLHPAVTVTVR